MASGIAHRQWAIESADYESDEAFRQAVENEQVLNVQIMERLGVATISGPKRVRLSDGTFVTVGWVFETATLPSARSDQDEGVEPGPVGAGLSDN